MRNPTLSVIIPNYNHAQHLPLALDAILSQTYQPKEVIVVDDASTDNSIAVIEAYVAKSAMIKLIRNEKNLGAVINVNRQLECAIGDYVCIVGADDKVLPDFFEKTIKLLVRYPQAGLCSGLALRMNLKGENNGLDRLSIVSRRPAYFTAEQCKTMICKYNNWIHSSATIYRREALLAAGGFIPDLYSYCDVIAGFVIALKYGVCFIPEPLAAFRITGGNYRSAFEKQPEMLLEVNKCLNALISSSYAGLFPGEFIKDIERTATYNYNRLRCSSSADRNNGGSKRFNDSGSTPAGLRHGVIHRLLHSENIISKLYYFIYSGRNIYHPLLRKALKYSHPLIDRKCRQIKI